MVLKKSRISLIILYVLFPFITNSMNNDIKLSDIGVKEESGGKEYINPLYLIQESLVQINGVDYKKIEFRNKIFYLKTLSPVTDQIQQEIKCIESPIGEPINRIKITPGPITKKYAPGLFIQTLDLRCIKGVTWVEFLERLKDFGIGYKFKSDKNSNIQNKKIIFNPLKGFLNFSGEF